MIEQLSEQLQNSNPRPQSFYSRTGLSLVIFGIFLSYFLYHQVINQVNYLTYRDTIAVSEASSQLADSYHD